MQADGSTPAEKSRILAHAATHHPAAHLHAAAPRLPLHRPHAHSEQQVCPHFALARLHQLAAADLAALAHKEALAVGCCIAGDVLSRAQQAYEAWRFAVHHCCLALGKLQWLWQGGGRGSRKARVPRAQGYHCCRCLLL